MPTLDVGSLSYDEVNYHYQNLVWIRELERQNSE